MSQLTGAASTDPSRPVFVKIQKWAIFSILLATLGIGSDIVATLMNGTSLSIQAVLSKGELYMVSIGIILSACGELLYDRARTHAIPAWEMSMSIASAIFGVFVGFMYALAKSGSARPEFVTTSSLYIALFAVLWGALMVVRSCKGRPKDA